MDEKDSLGEANFGRIELFFGDRWNSFIGKFHVPIIVIFSIWTIVSVIYALKLRPISQEE